MHWRHVLLHRVGRGGCVVPVCHATMLVLVLVLVLLLVLLLLQGLQHLLSLHLLRNGHAVHGERHGAWV